MAASLQRKQLNAALVAVFVIFALMGASFASWAARLPAAKAQLDVSTGTIGTMMFVGSFGGLAAMSVSGFMNLRYGTKVVIRLACVFILIGLGLMALGLHQHNAYVVTIGLVVFGLGFGTTDSSMNLEGAGAERELGKTIMPQMHAAFSGGAIAGALLASAIASHVTLTLHLLIVAGIVVILTLVATHFFLPRDIVTPPQEAKTEAEPTDFTARDAWREYRTLMIGGVMLGCSVAEGAGNDWIAVAVVDGYKSTASLGALMFAIFVGAMTIVRLFGGMLLDSFGRVPVLKVSFIVGVIGLLGFVFSPWYWLAAVSVALWGGGIALGFPLGMSAAADDPRRAAVRVAVVATLGYGSFLAGPPLLGHLGDAVGIRPALLTLLLFMLFAFLFSGHMKTLVLQDKRNTAN